MKEYILNILGNAAVFAVIGSAFIFILKKWLEGFLSTRFKRELEITKAELDVQKERLRKLEEKRDFIYPEILELVYRLRNQIRDAVISIKKYLATDDDDKPYHFFPSIGQELYKLTENLYTYRAYIDDETFENMHRFKRIMQDAAVKFNRISRPIDNKSPDTFMEEQRKHCIETCNDSVDYLENSSTKADELYKDITERIQQQIKASLHEIRT